MMAKQARRVAFLVYSSLAIGALTVLVSYVQLSAPERPAMTVEQAQIDLGRHLFYDRRLSGAGEIACASCHQQRLGFSDGQPTATNAHGELLARNTPGLLNVAQLNRFSWANPGRSRLEEQISVALFATAPPEMGVSGHEASVLARLRADPAYRQRFAAAFPAADPIGWAQISSALSAFTGSLSANNSPYDRFVQGDSAALSLAAQRGQALFFSAGLACGHCHRDLLAVGRAGPPGYGEATYLSNGAGRSPDQGLAASSGDAADAYRFRVPPLRNVAVTAPYMHDGSLATLDAVIRFYETGGQQGSDNQPARATARHPLIAGFTLTDSERRDLISFLNALTDQEALTAIEYSDPFLGP